VRTKSIVVRTLLFLQRSSQYLASTMDGTFDMSQSLDPSSEAYLHVSFAMEEEDISTAPDSPIIESADLSREQAIIVKQRASLQTYLSSLPYNTESEEDMQARLEFILGRIIICAEAKNWLVLATWDGVLQWCARVALCILLYRVLIIVAGCSCVIPCPFGFAPSSRGYIMNYAFSLASSHA
jgi:hypothetical protein